MTELRHRLCRSWVGCTSFLDARSLLFISIPFDKPSEKALQKAFSICAFLLRRWKRFDKYRKNFKIEYAIDEIRNKER